MCQRLQDHGKNTKNYLSTESSTIATASVKNDRRDEHLGVVDADLLGRSFEVAAYSYSC